MSDISQNIQTLKASIDKIAKAHDIKQEHIHLVAVSKRQPLDKLKEALDSGHRLFGENRVQEAMEHWVDFKKEHNDIKLHLIGPLQTNKVKDAVSFFDVIETVDREKLAKALSREMKKQGRALPCFVQVNTGDEPQKAGISPKDLGAFLNMCRDLDLNIIGLMCIPPVDEPPALHFAFLKKLAQENGLNNLSMGMSADYDRAIPLCPDKGQLYIRIGTGVFGARDSA